VCRCELCIPLVDRILVTHAQITPRANRNKVLYRHIAALTLGSVMTALVIEYIHLVRTPNDLTLSIKLATNLQEPHLFAEGLWNLLFYVAH
jgi:hypothetical protein